MSVVSHASKESLTAGEIPLSKVVFSSPKMEDIRAISREHVYEQDGPLIRKELFALEDSQVAHLKFWSYIYDFLGVVLTDEYLQFGLSKLLDDGRFGEFALPALLETPPDGTFEGHADVMLQAMFPFWDVLKSSKMAEKPTTTLPRTRLASASIKVPAELAQERILILGDGPAGILTKRMLHDFGYKNVALLGKGKKDLPPRGAWNFKCVHEGGHNTFAWVKAYNSHLREAANQPGGENVHNFLDSLTQHFESKDMIKGVGLGLDWDAQNSEYILEHRNNGESVTSTFDTVFLCTGGMPRPFNAPNAPMTTNADEFEKLPLRRYQEQLTFEQTVLFRNTSPVCVGLGPSTLEMLRQFIELDCPARPNGPVVLTHYTSEQLRNPFECIDGQQPIFRHPSNLAKIPGDIEEHREVYDEAIRRGWILPAVKHWEVNQSPEGGIYIEARHDFNGRDHYRVITNVPMIYGLIGYVAPSTLARFGCLFTESGSVDIEPVTNRVRTKDGVAKNVYCLGTASASPHDPNQAVIPGIMRSIGQTVLTHIVAGHARLQNNPESVEVSRFRVDGRLPKVLQRDLMGHYAQEAESLDEFVEREELCSRLRQMEQFALLLCEKVNCLSLEPSIFKDSIELMGFVRKTVGESDRRFPHTVKASTKAWKPQRIKEASVVKIPLDSAQGSLTSHWRLETKPTDDQQPDYVTYMKSGKSVTITDFSVASTTSAIQLLRAVSRLVFDNSAALDISQIVK